MAAGSPGDGSPFAEVDVFACDDAVAGPLPPKVPVGKSEGRGVPGCWRLHAAPSESFPTGGTTEVVAPRLLSAHARRSQQRFPSRSRPPLARVGDLKALTSGSAGARSSAPSSEPSRGSEGVVREHPSGRQAVVASFARSVALAVDGIGERELGEPVAAHHPARRRRAGWRTRAPLG